VGESSLTPSNIRVSRQSLQSHSLAGARECVGVPQNRSIIIRHPRSAHGVVCRRPLPPYPPLAHDLLRQPCGSNDPAPALPRHCSTSQPSSSTLFGTQVESFTDEPDGMNVAVNFWFQGHSLATRLYRTLRENVFLNCTLPAPEGAIHPCRDSVLPPRPPPAL
jgi:hypothetical protein